LAVSRSPVLLADVRWTWRRVYVYGRSVFITGLLVLIILRLDDAASLKALALTLCGLLLVDALLYLAGATTTDITRLTVAARTGHEPEEPKP
jgi:hypothetical protein